MASPQDVLAWAVTKVESRSSDCLRGHPWKAGTAGLAQGDLGADYFLQSFYMMFI